MKRNKFRTPNSRFNPSNIHTSMLIHTTREDHRIAWLTALAVTIHIAESALPSPLPGIKPGLANVVTVVVLIQFGFRMAMWVNLLRVVVGSLLIGTFLSPTFILSLSGAIVSLLLLGFLTKLPGRGCGPIGLSVVAAMGHVWAQVWVAYELFIPHAGLFRLLPVLMMAALVFGIVNGVIAFRVIEQLKWVRTKTETKTGVHRVSFVPHFSSPAVVSHKNHLPHYNPASLDYDYARHILRGLRDCDRGPRGDKFRGCQRRGCGESDNLLETGQLFADVAKSCVQCEPRDVDFPPFSPPGHQRGLGR
jgi:heptaprenyl diphosphate synthase